MIRYLKSTFVTLFKINLNKLKMKKSLLLLSLGVITLASCKKEGCTDPDALNYNEEAKKDDGTCTYFTLNVPSTYSFTDGSNTAPINPFSINWVYSIPFAAKR